MASSMNWFWFIQRTESRKMDLQTERNYNLFMGNCGAFCCNQKHNFELETYTPVDDNITYMKFTDQIPSPESVGDENVQETPCAVHQIQENYTPYPESMVLIEQTNHYEDRQRLPPLQLEDLAVYMGEWKQGQRDGYGVIHWQDGSWYEGQWKADKSNGKGTMYHKAGNKYVGDWLNGMAHGYGVFSQVDGTVYEGQWAEDKQSGQGTERWKDGSIYQGGYKNGEKNGQGVLTLFDGAKYVGEFEDGQINGKGMYKWCDGREYKGEWKKNKMEGKGLMVWPDGRKYEGEYVDDKKNGYGTFVWKDGREFRGYWKSGKQDGYGMYKNEQGVVRCGMWRNSLRIRWLDEEETQELVREGVVKEFE